MSQSKYVTILGLVLGALGGALGFFAQQHIGGALILSVGLMLSGLGRSLLGPAMLFVVLSLSACKGGVPPNVVQGGVATIETAICVMNTYSKDKAAGQNDAQAVADCIVQCATDAATIARVLDAHHAAEMREMETAQ